MKSKFISAAVGSLLLVSAGLVSAAEPVTLTDSQMDTVSAGRISSTSSGVAAALLGFATTGSTTDARVTYFSSKTEASSVSLATGLLPVAATTAASSIR